MSLKRRIYINLRLLAKTKYAVFTLIALAFTESCISPISPMVLLIPMVLMNKRKAFRYVNIATLAALLGSILGYFLGYHLMMHIRPLIESSGHIAELVKVEHWFDKFGLWVLAPASILPFPPFKVFTIAAGAMKVNFIPFILVIILVRWIHFAIVPITFLLGKKVYLHKFHNKLTVQ